MNEKLLRQNLVTLFLVQASLGLISDNTRLLSIRFDDEHYLIRIIFKRDSELNREDAEDILSEFASQFSTNIDVDLQIEIVEGALYYPTDINERVIYMEKPSSSDQL